jgi:lysine 2,3-aminomutase
MNIHFAHPWELTPDVERACAMLANCGIPLGSQTVLLKGINDTPEVLRELFRGLVRIRVRPYYLLQMDLTRGTAHFRTPLSTGLKIMRVLRNHISGLALPHFVVDLPGGKGKVPLLPSYVEEIGKDRIVFRNFKDETCEYPLLAGEGEELGSWVSA